MTVKPGFILSDCSHRTRLGIARDGGYVICRDDMKEADFLLSFGLSSEWSFEQKFAMSNPNSPIHIYDYSVGLIVFIENFFRECIKFLAWRSNFRLITEKLRVIFRYISFFRNGRLHFRSRIASPLHGNLDVSIAEVFSRVTSNKIFLKVDIEGSEYRVLSEIFEFKDRIVGIAIEFHDVNFMFDKFNDALILLNKAFDIIHVHGNNYSYFDKVSKLPDAIELTFSRRPEHIKRNQSFQVPNGNLDFPNDFNSADYCFDFPSSLASITLR